MATAVETIKGRTHPSSIVFTEVGDESASRTRNEMQSEKGEEETMLVADDANIEARTSERIIDYVADPDTVETNRRLLSALGICVVIILVQAAFNLTLYLRRPDRIVVDRTAGGDRVVVMNNREFGLTDSVSLSPDEPMAGDKKYLASHFLNLYYGNNPDIRDRQLNEAIGLMIPSRGRELFEYLRRNRVLEKQSAESWQGRWTEQQVWVDAADPFTVHVIGTQALTRVVEGHAVEETHQLNLTVRFARDELGRADRNNRTGYQITWFGWEELPNTQGSPATPQTSATDSSTTTARPSGM